MCVKFVAAYKTYVDAADESFADQCAFMKISEWKVRREHWNFHTRRTRNLRGSFIRMYTRSRASKMWIKRLEVTVISSQDSITTTLNIPLKLWARFFFGYVVKITEQIEPIEFFKLITNSSLLKSKNYIT